MVVYAYNPRGVDKEFKANLSYVVRPFWGSKGGWREGERKGIIVTWRIFSSKHLYLETVLACS
jgi:hypothetical protein